MDATRDDRKEGKAAGGKPGFVLLHAPRFAELPPLFFFDKAVVTVGREGELDIVLLDASVSRKHATIERDDSGSWVVRDQKSTNGTLHGKRRITEATLADGDVVAFGDVALQFRDSLSFDRARYGLDGQVTGGRKGAKVTELVGGFAIDRVAQAIEKVAPTTLSCVIRGESGTGKELVARAVHRLSGRAGALVALNCAALPASLVESELFGYRRGAFSGADRDHKGLVRQAHGGTLFLDEIGDMPVEIQAKLLRVLEAREVRPLGSADVEPVDVRVVAASHIDLDDAVARGRFRGDLLARLAEHVFVLPPLRERREDVYLLVRRFLDSEGRSDVDVTPKAWRALVTHDWPWNVRELRSVVKRALAFADKNVIDEEHLPFNLDPDATAGDDAEEEKSGGRPSREELASLLTKHEGNVAAIARVFDREPAQIRRWLRRHGLVADEFRRK
jgi:sigma-54 dependent transcriptional regulator, acetoin dehydrogenase operon transcriptional activator AcoR